jgi:OOP family OmpA-OmpF porin
VLLVSYDILFEPNSATILESSQSNLDWVYRLVKQSPYQILIAGHTADIGIAEGQYLLSVQRSQAIKEYLVSRGIKESRLDAQGFGGTRPIADNDTEEGRAENRRVVFSILE